MLRDVENLDFALRSGSPAVDAGEPISDFEDRVGGLPDVGPFELGENLGTDWPRPRRTVFDVNPPARISGKQLPPRLVEFVEEPTGIEDSGSRSALPTRPRLLGNYPNPFNPSTRICFALSRTSAVSLELFNVVGQRLRTLVDGRVDGGYHEIVWDGLDSSGKAVGSGVYLASVETDGWRDIGRMVLLR